MNPDELKRVLLIMGVKAPSLKLAIRQILDHMVEDGDDIVKSAKVAKDLPKTVERYVKEHKEQGMDEDKAWAIAWSRYCVAGNTLVPTQNGLKSVEELYNEAAGQKVMHSDGVEAKPTRVRLASRYGEAASSHIIYTGTKSTVSVNTKHGYSLTCTPDHQILVLNENDYSTEWVEAQEALGRYAVLPTHGVWGARTTLPEIGYETNTWNNVIPFRQPRELSPALARLLGYLVAEGSVTEEGVEFSNTDPRLIRDFVRCSKEVFGQEPIVEWRDRSEEGWKDCGKVRLRTRWYREFFEALGLPPGTAHDKQVPSIIMEAPREMVREFLVGFVEGDGYTGDSDHLNRVDLSTSSEPLARQLHLLLLNFGIPASLECNARGYFNVRVHSKPMVVKYRDQIGTAFKKVAVSGDRQRQRGSEFEMIPAESLLKLGSKVRSAFPGTKRVSLSRLLRKWDALESCRGTEGVVDNIRELMNHGYYFDRVTQVEAQGETDVYDVSVPEDVSFVANGMIAHNCKYKNPGSPRCKQDGYFKGRDSSIAKRVASKFIRLSYLPNIPNRFRQEMESKLMSFIRAGLSPFPTEDPQRVESLLAGDIFKFLQKELPPHVSVSNADVHQFIGHVARQVDVSLRSSVIEDAMSDVLGNPTRSITALSGCLQRRSR